MGLGKKGGAVTNLSANASETLTQASGILTKKCVIENTYGEPHIHFNFEAMPVNLELGVLVQRWRKESTYSELAWDKELYAEITRAMLDIKEGAISIPFNSLDPDSNTWYLPMLHSVRILPHDEKMLMDVSLVKLKSEAAKAIVGDIA